MKKIISLLSLLFISAGCSLTSSGTLGVIKTLDGGGSWEVTNRIEGSKNTISDLSVSEMSFDPTDRQTIFLSSANSGLWVSRNAGTSWAPILSKISVYDFYIDPADTQNIYVAGIYNDRGKILRTRDGGGSWEEIYNEASVKNAVNTITVNPSNSRELYAALNSGVYIKSVDAGVNWFVLHEFEDQVLRTRFNRNNNTIYALMYLKGLAKSTNGGVTWTYISTSLTTKSYFEGESVLPQNVQAFVRLGMDDNVGGVIYLTTSSGLYKTTDDGARWSYINIPIKTSAEKPRAIASAKGGMIAYTSIGNTIFKSLNGGQSWQTQTLPTGNLVNKIIIDPNLPQITYAGLTGR